MAPAVVGGPDRAASDRGCPVTATTVYTLARTRDGLDAPDALRSTDLLGLPECLVDASSARWDGPWPEPGQTVAGVVRWRSRRQPLAILVPDMHVRAYARAERVTS